MDKGFVFDEYNNLYLNGRIIRFPMFVSNDIVNGKFWDWCSFTVACENGWWVHVGWYRGENNDGSEGTPEKPFVNVSPVPWIDFVNSSPLLDFAAKPYDGDWAKGFKAWCATIQSEANNVQSIIEQTSFKDSPPEPFIKESKVSLQKLAHKR